MKSYFDCLNELSENDLFEGLLSYGLFNHKLPPIFTSKKFYEFCLVGSNFADNEKRDWIRYENNRNNGLPREIAIPNPFGYYYQCKAIKEHWKELLAYFKQKTITEEYKVSRNHVRKLKGTKRIFEMNYENYETDGIDEPTNIIASRFVVKADISKCFSSLYTHTIGWAILGKKKAKSLPRNSNNFTNILDKETRKTSFGETHGILIGPITSNVISEIILCNIDNELIQNKHSFIRHIDDYLCFVESREEGERFLNDLRRLLSSFDLSINEKKTRIIPIADFGQQDLSNSIHRLDYLLNYSPNYNGVTYKQLINYFDCLQELFLKLENNLSVYLFAFKILSTKNLSINASRYFINKSLNLAFNNPYLLFGLEPFVLKPFGVTPDIKSFCSKLYQAGIKETNYEKSVYALYFAIIYDVRLEIDNIDDLFENSKKCDDCLLRLLSKLYSDKFYPNSYCDSFVQLANSLSVDDFDRNWIFIYETLSSEQLSGDWRVLKQNNISFVNKESLESETNWRNPFY